MFIMKAIELGACRRGQWPWGREIGDAKGSRWNRFLFGLGDRFLDIDAGARLCF
jgi:hypothetical protein